MLEILILIFLIRESSRVLKAVKGRSRAWALIAVMSWFMLGMTGALIAGCMGFGRIGIILFTLAGETIGAFIGLGIIRMIPATAGFDPGIPDVLSDGMPCPKCGSFQTQAVADELICSQCQFVGKP